MWTAGADENSAVTGRALPTSSRRALSLLLWRLFGRDASPARSGSPSYAPECCVGGRDGSPGHWCVGTAERVRGRRWHESLSLAVPLSRPAPGSPTISQALSSVTLSPSRTWGLVMEEKGVLSTSHPSALEFPPPVRARPSVVSVALHPGPLCPGFLRAGVCVFVH